MIHYFDTFPIGQYQGQYCRMITRRAALSQQMIKNTAAFYPYQLPESERPDMLSFMYYDDSSMEWLLFYANAMVDPYYDWYLSDEQFKEMLISKYGSLASTQQKTHHFEVNWLNDSSTKTLSAYDTLTSNLKRFWVPVLDDYGNVIYYKRKSLDLKATTNKIVRLDVDSVTGYELGEIVYQLSGSVAVASGEIDFVGDTYLLVKHVYGSLTAATLIGQESNASHTVSAVTTVQQNIPASEEVYWQGISIYDYEQSLNEQRKSIRVVQKNYVDVARNSLKSVMGT